VCARRRRCARISFRFPPRSSSSNGLVESLQEFPCFDSEVLVLVFRHSSGTRVCLNKPDQIARQSASCPAVCSVWPELTSVSFAAFATLETATLTCSTAVACCLVLSSISLAAAVVVPSNLCDLLERGGHFHKLPRAKVYRFGAAFRGHHRRIDRGADFFDKRANFLC